MVSYAGCRGIYIMSLAKLGNPHMPKLESRTRKVTSIHEKIPDPYLDHPQNHSIFLVIGPSCGKLEFVTSYNITQYIIKLNETMSWRCTKCVMV